MPEALQPDFRLYHSNSLEVLAGLLANQLRAPDPGQPLLAPDVVLIPQVAMRRWLQATLAVRHGVAANLEFLTPGEFVARALDANLGPAVDDLGATALHWRLYAALTDPTVLARPAMAQMAAYLADDDALKPWTLAGELASVFEKYQAWRRDWLLRWEAGAEPDDPQALLWRRIAAGRQYRARRIQSYLDGFERNDMPPPRALPTRVFAFATLNVSPDVLRVIATQARVGTLHFYMPTPTRAYWGDLQSLAGRLRSGEADPFEPAAGLHSGENPLLQAWGAAGRDFVAVLGSYEVVHPSGEIAAYADPETDAGPTLDAGGLSDSLLNRLQGDLFHRRPAPPQRLPALRRDDPSLQVHACHTRLRELQVLHDQLRGLLEDPRFDPPLQPREIAVLAPDIDPYAPYLEAVFGGRGEGADPIPYALADTSPLADEPLAQVFLQLLALPVSRFGRSEILGLLSSAPIATVAGLDTAALDRLDAWLLAAGARWGLDGAHRQGFAAPRDDACTWQFALDRLLLGHASGSEDDILGSEGQRVAPWTELEGSALDALDALLRLLRVLARHQKSLGDALPPATWRERLLGLLEAVLPAEPADAASQRALERLRRLIGDFAQQAERAGFDAPVPAEVVRAHFAAALAEADTRAPLLTGGVSFGRMVPMRLLPFRVICVLGLNDGDYPRRDPGAGLSRLTAELGTARRRPGDRSLREDDRFLFLQLFASAQDVFYLSYLGADPRDGSVREPSTLVSELVEAAADQHDDRAEAARALVVRHPLQPFAAAAFGEGEPRRFSYRQQWWPAASQPQQRRTALPPFFAGAALEAATDGEDGKRLSIDTLRRFLQAPAEVFLRHRLGLRLADIEAPESDVEPLLAPGRGMARQALQRAVFEAHLRGEDATTTHAKLRARGQLASGPLGRRTLENLRGEVEAHAEAFVAWRGDAVAAAPPLDVSFEGFVLHGRMADTYPHGIARVRFDPPNGTSSLRNGLDWLLASAAGLQTPLVQFHLDEQGHVGPHARSPLEPELARALLGRLLGLRASGLCAPLAFAPYSGWELFNAPTLERGLQLAANKWHGSDHGWGEGQGEALRLALRGRDPFTDEATGIAFVEQALTVYNAVVNGVLYGGSDHDALRKLAADLDLEPAE